MDFSSANEEAPRLLPLDVDDRVTLPDVCLFIGARDDADEVTVLDCCESG